MLYDKVMTYCKQNNLSVSAFEKKCNLSNGTVSKWKDADSDKTKISTLKRIAVGTGISLDKWVD